MPESLPLKAVIFDCDGVLVDTEPLHYRAFQEVLKPLGLGHDYEHYLRHYVGFDDRDAFFRIFGTIQQSVDPARIADLIKAKNEALLGFASEGVKGFPGVRELVDELLALHVPLAVASGSLRQEVMAFIGALDLRSAFSVIISAEDVVKSKPDPETYVRAVDRLMEIQGWKERESWRIVAIEDTPAGIRSAVNAGLYVVGVAQSYPLDRLSDANYVVDNMTQLDAPILNRLIDPHAS